MLQNYDEIRKRSYTYNQKSPKKEEVSSIDGTTIHQRKQLFNLHSYVRSCNTLNHSSPFFLLLKKQRLRDIVFHSLFSIKHPFRFTKTFPPRQ
jgi:hypothetical protein